MTSHDSYKQAGAAAAPEAIGEAGARPALRGKLVRRGRVSWLTHPPAGTARVGVERGTLGDLHAVPVAITTGEPTANAVAPGELLAIAYGMFVAGALADELMESETPADEIVVEASCAFSEPFPNSDLTHLDIWVEGRVPGLDDAAFREHVEAVTTRALHAAGARTDVPCELSAKLEPVA